MKRPRHGYQIVVVMTESIPRPLHLGQSLSFSIVKGNEIQNIGVQPSIGKTFCAFTFGIVVSDPCGTTGP